MNSLAILYIIFLASERIIQKDTVHNSFFRYVIYCCVTIILPLAMYIVRWQLAVFIVLILLRAVLGYCIKRYRLIINITVVPVILIIISFISFKRLPLNYYSLYIWHWLVESSFVFEFISSNSTVFLQIILGIFIVGFESNNIIRLVLTRLHFISDPGMQQKKETLDESEIRRGRVIGVLERLLIFFLIFVGQPAAVSLVVAVKGIYRYKTLEDKNFSEYVLIGSLLSLLTAIVLSYGVLAV